MEMRIKDVDDLNCTRTRCGRLAAISLALLVEEQEPNGQLHMALDEGLEALTVCRFKLLYVLFLLVDALAVNRIPVRGYLALAFEALLEKGDLTKNEIAELAITFDRLLAWRRSTEEDVDQFLRSKGQQKKNKPSSKKSPGGSSK